MLTIEKNLISSKTQLTEFFISGFKNSQLVGLEYEKIGVNFVNNKAVSYKKMEKFLEYFSEFENYSKIFNDEINKNLIGLRNEYGSISLEPGSQLELSLNPSSDIKILDSRLKEYNQLTKKIGHFFDIKWLGIGCQPYSINEDISLIPKKRYDYMTEFFKDKSSLSYVMMRETAGIQVSIDFKNEIDAIEKMQLALKLSPIVSAVYSNSPIHNKKLSKYKSCRAMSWLNTDEKRCGLISKSLFQNGCKFSFSDYVEILLDVPMIFLQKENTYFYVKDMTFREYLKNGYLNYQATKEDWETHLSLYFTDVRLKNYIEIRNHDSQKNDVIMTVPAFYKGIMYDKNSFEEINRILDVFDYEDYEIIRHNVPKYGLDFKIKNKKISDIAKEIFFIAYENLNKENEQTYLEPILEFISDGITPADVIIKSWEGCWNGDFNKFVKYIEL